MVEEYRQKMQDNLETAAASYGISADSYALYNYGMNCEDMVNTYAEDSLPDPASHGHLLPNIALPFPIKCPDVCQFHVLSLLSV